MAQKESRVVHNTSSYSSYEFVNDTGADLNATLGEVFKIDSITGRAFACCVHTGDKGNGTLAQNESGAIIQKGVMEFKKNTSKAFAVGDQVYWDASANEANDDTTANTADDFCLGTCIRNATASSFWVQVEMNYGPEAFHLGSV